MNNTHQGQAIKLDLRIIPSDSNADTDGAYKSQLLQAMVLGETKMLTMLPNDYTEAWKKLLEWRGISQAELHRRTLIPEKTIGNIINCRNIGSIDNVVMLCLAANLPEDMSMYLIERSGRSLLKNNEDHIWYSFALKHLYSLSLKEIRAFFRDYGISTYNKFPEINADTEI